jgi:hypothetical protein
LGKTTIVERGKRRRDADLDRPLPSGPRGARGPGNNNNNNEDEEEAEESLEFDEVLDEELLSGRSVVVNRAPIMTAWATVVAERLGFKRQEALSLGMYDKNE